MDVPTQQIALDNLKTFFATGRGGSISTEDLPGFGKVIRFQSHGHGLVGLGIRSTYARIDHVAQLLDLLCFA
ncbi:hypothetical protein SCARD494_08931 [Seiridium cardinale]